MAIVVYPLNNIDFTAEDVAIYNSTRTSGIYAGDDFAISLTGSDNTISIDVGLAWLHLSRFNGVAAALKAKTFVDMGLPNATYPRIDALVLQFDANKNGAELVSKQGTASSDPKPPAVSRTEALYELHLLHVLRKPGAASITAADVTDLRLNAQYCGLMADAVTRVDTAAIDAQVTALIQKLREDLKAVQDQTYYASKDEVAAAVESANKYAQGLVENINPVSIGATSVELLWVNGSPGSTFVAQLIKLDLSDYWGVYIEYRGHTATMLRTTTGPIKKDDGVFFISYIGPSSGMDDMDASYREFVFDPAGIYFRDCVINELAGSQMGVTANSECTPLRIYGIKGVAE